MKLSKVILTLLPGMAAAQEPLRDLPDLLSNTPTLSTFAEALNNHTQLFTRLLAGNITIFAPTNDAFAKWQGGSKFNVTDNVARLDLLLGYHILDGIYHDAAFGETTQFLPTLLGDSGEPTAATHRNLTGRQQVLRVERHNTSRVVSMTNGDGKFVNITEPDHEFNGGTMHLVDGVLHPPAQFTRALEDTGMEEMLGYLQTTGLKETLDGLAAATFFVPSNAAFTNLSEKLDTYTTEDLRDVLSYHVVPNYLEYSTKLINNTKLKTMQGREVTLRLLGDELWVNGARVATPDVLVGGGVVHVLEGVLNPSYTEDAPGGIDAWEIDGTVVVVPGETDLAHPKTGGAGRARVSAVAVGVALLAAFV